MPAFTANKVTYTDDFAFFWDGPLSQWQHAPFLSAGTLYTCCEQYMMAEKARVFGDSETLAKILTAPTPRIQKALGRQVQNFDEAIWKSVCRGIVYTANLAKFQKHKDLAQILLDTGNRTIVEASPVDPVWGIGLAVDHPDALDPTKWPGTNWLGIALMQVRSTLRGEPLTAELLEQLQKRTSAGATNLEDTP